jgi:uncharacterized membrane protein YtjA (UPF0391 family)
LYYAAALLLIAITAEAVGLGGIPAREVEFENILFVVLLLTFVVMICKRFARR